MGRKEHMIRLSLISTLCDIQKNAKKISDDDSFRRSLVDVIVYLVNDPFERL